MIGLSYLFTGSLLVADAVTKWGSAHLWTYKYGTAAQIIGFALSLASLMTGQEHFRFDSLGITSEWLTAVAGAVVAVATLVGVIYAIAQYSLSKRDREERERPYIFVELERVVSGLFDLVIVNTGTRPAVNIAIKFSPDVTLFDHSETTINDMKIMQNMKFLAPGKSLSFYFGSVMGGKTVICQEFKLSIKYRDVSGKEYITEQSIDPRDYLDQTNISRKDINDVGKALEDIAKSLNKLDQHYEYMQETVASGLTLRNPDLQSLDQAQLFNLLANIAKYGDQYEVMGGSRRDIKVIVRLLRDKYLTRPSLTRKEQTIVAKLNALLADRFLSGDNSFEKTLAELTALRSVRHS